MNRFTFDVKRGVLAVMLMSAVPVLLVGAVATKPERSPQLKNESGVDELRLESRYAISAALGRELKAYHIEAKGEDLRAANTAQSLTARFSLKGVDVRTGKGSLGLKLSAWGYGTRLRAVEPARPQAAQNRVEYRRGPLTEWYVNGPFGLQQGFTVEAAPPGNADGDRPLRLSLALGGGLTAVVDQDQCGLILRGRDGRVVLQYRGLTVTDAGGRQARTWLEMKGNVLLVNVDDGGMRYPLQIDPLIFRELAKPTASDGAADDRFGFSAAVSGDVVVVGAPDQAIGTNAAQGSAYVFVNPGTGWTQAAKLTASDGAAGDSFGNSVAVSFSYAIDANMVVVGAPDHTIGANAGQGSAYVFATPASGWADMTETAKLTASDGAAGDHFGTSVAADSDLVVVGAPYHTIGANAGQGSAYVFANRGTGWSQTGRLTASDGAAGDHFGTSVAADSDLVVVGAPYHTIGANAGQGSAYVFLEPVGGWPVAGWVDMTETAKLTASDGAAGDSFGFSAAILVDEVVVGAPDHTIGANAGQGSAYVFEMPATGWADMTETAKATASDGAAGDHFGKSVAVGYSSVLTAEVVAVGAPGCTINANANQGSAYVYALSFDPGSGGGGADGGFPGESLEPISGGRGGGGGGGGCFISSAANGVTITLDGALFSLLVVVAVSTAAVRRKRGS